MRSAAASMLLVLLAVIPFAHGLEPPPSGTPYGTMYVRVTDCSSEEPLVGASVTLENPGHTASAATNTTGYAVLEAYEWFYRYYVTASGYKIAYGERKFTVDAVFQVCLIREAGGFWRVVSTITMWQGDIHAGGVGWAIVRLKNLEPGYFEIYGFEIWVSGYGDAVAEVEYHEPRRLGRNVESEFNITVAPPPDSPVGRLAAQLKTRATFTYDDGRKIGPLTIITQLDHVEIMPYRSFTLRVADFWGLHPVPNATIIMETTLPGATAQHVLYGDSLGNVQVRRLRDGVYHTQIYYTSPYDDGAHLVKSYFPLLADLARYREVRTDLYEVRVDVVDLAGRPLNTAVSLGMVTGESQDGAALFKNVPRGLYDVRVWWRGVEVFRGSLNVDEPFSRPNPGGYLRAVADVGDLILELRDADGESLSENITLTIRPGDMTAVGREVISFIQLPSGDYEVTATKYNNLTDEMTEVGRYLFKIPVDHGKHVLRLEVYNVELVFLDAVGEPAHLDRVEVGDAPYIPREGRVKLDEVCRGRYPVRAEWLGVKVFDDIIVLPDTNVVTAAIFPLNLSVRTVDGEWLLAGETHLKVGNTVIESKISNGVASFPAIPGGLHHLTVFMGGAVVYDGRLEIRSSEAEVAVAAGRLRVRVLDQDGDPIKSAHVQAEGLSGAQTDEHGIADLGQQPLNQYSYTVIYRGLVAGSGVAEAGETVDEVVGIYWLRVGVVNQLGQPVEAEVELSADGRYVAAAEGSAVLFSDLPAGTYKVRVTHGTKQVEEEAVVSSGGNEIAITLPFALSLGPGLTLSLSDLWIIVTPVALALILAASLWVLVRALGKASAKRAGVPRI